MPKLPSENLNKELKKDLEKHDEKVENRAYSTLISQLDAEYELCKAYLRPKLSEWQKRLKLYNNQKRDKKAIGDPLLFTVFQTIFAGLYEDMLVAEFLARERGDDEVAENLNHLAVFDFDEMEKDILDFTWIWDTLFFGNAPLLFSEFDRKIKTPIPEAIDPFTLLRDPRAVSFNGFRGRNGARFWFREISLSKYELEKNPAYFNTGQLKPGKGLKSLEREGKEARITAQGLQTLQVRENALDENAEYNLVECYTHLNGRKHLITLGNDRKLVVRKQELEDSWPAINRSLFPIAHDWDGVSIPDLAEDKQRARAKLQNLGLQAAEADLYPKILFDKKRIKNVSALRNYENTFVPVDGEVGNAALPLQKPTVHREVSWIMDILDQSAQRALATPEIQQGIISREKRTLGELELVSAKVDTRYSLAAKIFGWSEKRFWRQWYHLYKKHFKEGIDEKVVRLAGVFGPKWRELKRDNIVASIDPDIKIESKAVSDAKRYQERILFERFVGLVFQDPTANKRFALKKLGRLNGLNKEEVDLILPLTISELQAEDENELLAKGQMPPIDVRDEHIAHLEIHGKAEDNEAKLKHIEAHKKAMLIQRRKPELFPEEVTPTPEKVPIPTEEPAKGRSATIPATYTR